MNKFFRAFVVIFMLGGAVGVGGCAMLDKVIGSVNQPRETRDELLRTERIWQLTLGVIQVLTARELIVPNSELAKKLAASIVIVELAMDKWRANPDDVTIKVFALASIDTVKKIVEEVRE